MEGVGITYVFLGKELGGLPEDPALRTAEGRVDYEKVAGSALYHQGLDRLRTAHQKAVRLGESLFAEGIEVGHIDHDGEVRSHEDVRRRWLEGQGLKLF